MIKKLNDLIYDMMVLVTIDYFPLTFVCIVIGVITFVIAIA